MRYRVKAVGPDSAVVEAQFEAATEAEARAQAAARGLAVLSLQRAATARGRARFPLMLFNQELLALLHAGIPRAEAISALVEKEQRSAVRGVLSHILTALREGRTLSSALEARPEVFPELYVAMIRAAERTSDLESALTRYIAYREQLESLRGKLVDS